MDTTSIIGTKNKKGKSFTDPRVMMREAPRTPSFFTGSEVIKEAIRRANVDVMVAYPITPQSEAAALMRRAVCRGLYRRLFPWGERICGHVAVRRRRIRRSPGLHDDRRAGHHAGHGKLSDVGRSRLPIQCIVTCRGINSPLSIQPDTIEIAYLMNTGMLVWHAETAQDFYDWILKGYMVSEEPDVHLPLALCCDGFFVTHTKDVVDLTPADMCLPPYDPYRSPVPCMDMECPPVRMMRDPFVMKSNYISYATHASWQQEVWAAAERSRKHTIAWLDGLIETENVDADILIVTSGTAVSQGREAIRLLADEGIRRRTGENQDAAPLAGGRNSRSDQACLAHHRAGVQCHRVDGERNQSHDSPAASGSSPDRASAAA